MAETSWERHYHREKSALIYPDENLVRLLKKIIASSPPTRLRVMDFGCGSGRHLKLLNELGIEDIIGIDSSRKALELSKGHSHSLLVQNNGSTLPLKDNSLDIIIAWGSLHYAEKDHLTSMVGQLQNALKKNGSLLATIRSARDTYLKKGKHLGNDVWITDLHDIKGATVSFYSEEELQDAFSSFCSCTYGIIERSLMGDTSSLISHWVIHAVK